MNVDHPKKIVSVVLAGLLFNGTSLLAEDSPEKKQTQLSTIVVTGEKIDRPMKETFNAVSVMGGETLDPSENQSAFDMTGRVPNMLDDASELPTIRGITGTGVATGGMSFASGARPRISTTIDGIPQAWSGQRYMDVGLWDVDQVEVMRGPQSTIQGRNSIGGAIVVKTKDPTFTPEGAIRFGHETEGDKLLLATALSFPLVEDTLAVRLSAQGINGNGFITYPNASSLNFDPSEIKKNSFKSKFLWKPKSVPELTARVTLNYRTQKGEYLNYVKGFPDSPADYVYTASSLLNTRYTDSLHKSIATDFNYELSQDWKLQFLYSRSSDYISFEQAPSVFPVSLAETSNSAEMRGVYDPKNGSWEGVFGLYYYDRDQDISAATSFEGEDQTDTLATYTDLTFNLTDKLGLILGGRVEREHQDRDVVYAKGTARESDILVDVKETVFLPKGGMFYRITPDTNIGFTVRKGYSPGGGSVDFTNFEYYEYDKEEVMTYEVATRSEFMDKRLSLNTNTFYNRYDDYQALLSSKFYNIPKGETYGFELDTSYLVTPDLDIYATWGLLRSKVTESTTANPELEGNEFSMAPATTLGLGFKQYLTSQFYVGSDAKYVGEYYSGVDNNEDHKAGRYTVINLNVGHETDILGIRAYAKNITDETIIYQKNSAREDYSIVGQPLAFGITVDYRF